MGKGTLQSYSVVVEIGQLCSDLQGWGCGLYAISVSHCLGAAPGKRVALMSQARWLSSAKGSSPKKGQL